MHKTDARLLIARIQNDSLVKRSPFIQSGSNISSRPFFFRPFIPSSAQYYFRPADETDRPTHSQRESKRVVEEVFVSGSTREPHKPTLARSPCLHPPSFLPNLPFPASLPPLPSPLSPRPDVVYSIHPKPWQWQAGQNARNDPCPPLSSSFHWRRRRKKGTPTSLPISPSSSPSFATLAGTPLLLPLFFFHWAAIYNTAAAHLLHRRAMATKKKRRREK